MLHPPWHRHQAKKRPPRPPRPAGLAAVWTAVCSGALQCKYSKHPPKLGELTAAGGDTKRCSSRAGAAHCAGCAGSEGCMVGGQEGL
eukprot:1027167-Pelagomonas_calceolata.AAC.6